MRKNVPATAQSTEFLGQLGCFVPLCRDEYVTCFILSSFQFDFSYSSAIITINSAFIHGLSASNLIPWKPVVVHSQITPSKTRFFPCHTCALKTKTSLKIGTKRLCRKKSPTRAISRFYVSGIPVKQDNSFSYKQI